MYTLKFRTAKGLCLMKFHDAGPRDHYALRLITRGIVCTLSKVPA
ncbi:hypothetical protein [Paraburkholderia phenoliruptrix]